MGVPEEPRPRKALVFAKPLSGAIEEGLFRADVVSLTGDHLLIAMSPCVAMEFARIIMAALREGNVTELRAEIEARAQAPAPTSM